MKSGISVVVFLASAFFLIAQENEALEEFFDSTERFQRGRPWTISEKEEIFLLEKLDSEDRVVQRKFLSEIEKFFINTPKLRNTLVEMMDNAENQNFSLISNDVLYSLSHDSCHVLARLYSVSLPHTLSAEEQRIELKKELNIHPDFEGRFTEELANSKQSERKSLDRPDSSSETSTGAQSVDTPQKSPTENPRSFAWLYWVLGVLILGGVGVLVWNSRKGSSAR